MRFNDFELDTTRIAYALRDDRLVYDFVTNRRVRDVAGQQAVAAVTDERKKEFCRKLAKAVASFDDIDYDACSELAGRLVISCVDYLSAYLDASNVENCMRNNVRPLAEGIRAQLMEHAEYESGGERVLVQPGSFTLKANALSVDQGETPRPFDIPIAKGERSRIRSMVFTGFSKCLFTLQKFDSEPERMLSERLERWTQVRKWFKPTLSNLRLYYGPNEYTPDFVVETDTQKLLVETCSFPTWPSTARWNSRKPLPIMAAANNSGGQIVCEGVVMLCRQRYLQNPGTASRGASGTPWNNEKPIPDFGTF